MSQYLKNLLADPICFVVASCQNSSYTNVTGASGSWYKYTLLPNGDGFDVFYMVIRSKAIELFALLACVHDQVALYNYLPADLEARVNEAVKDIGKPPAKA